MIAPNAYLHTLKVILAAERVSSAFYYGYGHADVLRLLVSELPLGAVQAMEMVARTADADRLEFQRQGVIFWDEGGHPAELLVRDYRWSSAKQLKTIIEWSGRHPSRVFFLAGQAADVDRHDAYDWEMRDGCLVGRQKVPQPEVWRSLEPLNKRRYEQTKADAARSTTST